MPIKPTRPIQLRKWDEGNLENFEVSPDLYTHLVIIEALKAVPKGLETGNANSGLIALTISVDQLEQIMRARKLLTDEDKDYYDQVKKKKDELETEGIKDIMLQARIANFKLGLFLSMIFGGISKDVEMIL